MSDRRRAQAYQTPALKDGSGGGGGIDWNSRFVTLVMVAITLGIVGYGLMQTPDEDAGGL